MAGLKQEKRKVNGVKNKVGSRDNGRPVRSIATDELKSIHEKIVASVKGKRDRSKVERELRRRGVAV